MPLLSRIAKLFVGLVISLSVIVATLWLFTPYALNMALSQLYPEQPVTISFEKARFNALTLSFEIKQLKLQKAQQSLVTLEQLYLDIDALALWDRQIKFDQFMVNNTKLELVEQNKKWQLMGIELPIDKPNQGTVHDEASKSTYLAWQIIAPKIQFNNVQLNVHQNQQLHQIKLTHLFINRLEASADKQQFIAKITSEVEQQKLQAHIEISKNSEQLAVNIKQLSAAINSQPIAQLLPENVKQFETNVKMSGRLTLAQQSQLNSTFNLELAQLRFADTEQQMSVEQVAIPAISLQADIGEKLSVTASIAKAIIKQVAMSKQQQLLFAADSIAFEQLNASYKQIEPNTVLIQLNKGVIDRIQASKVASTMPAMAKINQLVVEQLRLQPKQLVIAQVSLDNSELELLKNTEGKITTIIDFSNDKKTTPARENKTEPEQQGFSYQIANITGTGSQKIHWQDNSVSPAVNKIINIEQFTVSDINSGLTPVKLNLIGKIDGLASVHIDGQVVAKSLDMQLKSRIENLDLIPFSPYLVQAGGYAVKAGQFNGELKLTTKQLQVDGTLAMNIKGIALNDSVSLKQSEVDSAIPLNLAIEQLTDSQGNLVLDVPISGKIDAINFSTRGVLQLIAKKAIIESTKTYLVQTFIPYANVANIAMLLGNKLLATTVDDLIYQPRQLKVSATQQDFVNKLSQQMNKQAKMQLIVCPQVINQDIGLTANSTLTEQQQQALRRFGISRAKFFINAMKAKNIAQNRFVLCQTELSKNQQTKLSFIAK